MCKDDQSEDTDGNYKVKRKTKTLTICQPKRKRCFKNL